jgi:PAS domain S-box-containing protein
MTNDKTHHLPVANPQEGMTRQSKTMADQAPGKFGPVNKPIRILILEDREADAELAIHEVKRAGFIPDWRRVETEADFLSGLANAPEVILSDFNLPQFDGLKALALLRGRGLDVPFILVSGSLGEEVAVESIRLGADDYILKDRLVRLGPAVQRVLEERRLRKERNQVEEELHATHAQLRQVLEHSPAVIYALKVQGQNLVPYVVSENMIHLLGFTVAEALSYEWWFGRLHPEDRERAVASMSETLALGTSCTEYRIRHKDGSYRWVEDQRRVIRDLANQPKEVAGVWTDITERKRAEEVLCSVSSREVVSRKKRIHRDLAVIFVLTVLVFAGAHQFGLFEKWFVMLSDQRKYPPTDEFFGTFGFVNLALLVFSYRRWRESVNQALSQKNVVESLRILHDELDRRVQQRTAELAKSNTTLQAEIVERQKTQVELEATHRNLVDASRQAGMAEMATSVLHNVGNVLNSVNVASTCMADGLRKSKAANLSKVTGLLREHEQDLGAYLTEDPKGKLIPAYLTHLGELLAGEQSAALDELAQLQKNIEHIKEIVTIQQSGAKTGGVAETLDAAGLMEDALKMNASSLGRHAVGVRKEFDDVLQVTTQKHKALQILVNLIRNASQACDNSGQAEKNITLRVKTAGERVRFSVSDNGVGIPSENLARIFTRGFTTKKDGHGFGLNNAALVAKELGGALTVHSDGPGKGSTFALELPCGTLKPATDSEAGRPGNTTQRQS